jgi:hypothetical protein
LLVAGGCLFPGEGAFETTARRNVSERVKFDLGCDGATLVRLGDVARLGQQVTRVNIGATCASGDATYVVTCVSNWGSISCTPELNSRHEAAPPAQAAAAPQGS